MALIVQIAALCRRPLEVEQRARSCPHCGAGFAFYYTIPTSLRQWIDGGRLCPACRGYFQPRWSPGAVAAALALVGIFGYDVAMYGAVWTVVWIEIAAAALLLAIGLVLAHTAAAGRLARLFSRAGPVAPACFLVGVFLAASRLARASHGVDAEVLVSPSLTTGAQFVAIMLPFGFVVPTVVGLWGLDTWPLNALFRLRRRPCRAEIR